MWEAAKAMRRAKRIETIPPYIFAQMDKRKAELTARGADVIALGIGDPDQPTPDWIVEEMGRAIKKPAYHRYPDYEGSKAYREGLADWYRRRFSVDLDPDKEVMALIGSKEGLAHLIWAYVDPGDVVLIPDPAYPVYRTHTLLCGGDPYLLPLLPKNKFLPDLEAIPAEIARRAKILFINYPNNPTSAVADLDFFRRAVDFCRRYDILLASDNAYAEMTYDDFVAPSALSVEGAKDVAVEFYSFSKPFNMTGWRIAAMVGNQDAIGALGIIKTNTDSGQFTAIQEAAVAGFDHRPRDFFVKMNEMYARRRDVFIAGMNSLGWPLEKPKGTFYVWVPTPPGQTSGEFAGVCLEKAAVVVTPGVAYGPHGEGFVRVALTVPEERLKEAVDRLAKAGVRYR